ncbi:MAG: carboxypeptidase regulatory-like domain-containing protein [Gammaproteobacteria bacterium]|nr:carboxypeptidase regulatory-like domain-containing protein [Gammaproteobacteria bacterium]
MNLAHRFVRGITLIAVMLSFVSSAFAEDAARIMLNVVTDVVASSGVDVIAAGSWTDETSAFVDGKWTTINKSFKDVRNVPIANMSDIDMRLVMDKIPANAAEQQAMARQWLSIRNRVATKAGKQLAKAGYSPAQIAAILERTSVYPPRQLMEGVSSVEDAVLRYKELGGFPSPGNEKDLKKLAEGLYGEGQTAFTQHWENGTGKHVFRDGAKVRVARADLQIMKEGYARYTLAGRTNLSRQFATKAGDYLKGQPREAMKNLKRLQQQMRNARLQAGVGVGSAGDAGLDSLIKEYEKLAGKFDLSPPGSGASDAVKAAYRDEIARFDKAVSGFVEGNKGRIGGLLEKTHGDIFVLETIEQLGVHSREAKAMRRLLESSRWQKMLNGMKKVAASTGAALPTVMRALVVIAAAAELYDASQVALEEGVNSGLIDLGTSAIRWTNLPAALVEMIIEDAKGDAMGMVATFQECTDLMAGIYTVKGRERLTTGENIEQLAQRLMTREAVLEVVNQRARASAQRQFEAINAAAEKAMRETEDGIAANLMQRCGPQVVRLWANARSRMFEDLEVALSHLDEILDKALLGVDMHQTLLADGAVQLVSEAVLSTDLSRLSEALRTLDARIKALAGGDPDSGIEAREQLIWTLDGEVVQARDHTVLPKIDGQIVMPDGLAQMRQRFPPGESHRIGLQWRLFLFPRLDDMDDPLRVTGAVGDRADTRMPIMDWAINPRGTLEPGYEMYRRHYQRRSGEQLFATAPQMEETVPTPLSTGILRARVLDAVSGAPVAGARITLDGVDTDRTASSDGDGIAEIEGVVDGPYSLIARHPDYRRWWQSGLRFTRPAGKPVWGLKGTIRLQPKPKGEMIDRDEADVARTESRIVVQRSQASCGFADAYLPEGDKTDVGQKALYTVPGKGRIAVTFVYKAGRKSTVRYYGDASGYRSHGALRWSSPDGIAANGRLLAGSLYKAGEKVTFLSEVSNQGTIVTSGPGTLEFKVYPEATPASQSNGKWHDDWYGSTHTHHHGGGCEIRLQFVGMAP